jgi:hypothetical protein
LKLVFDGHDFANFSINILVLCVVAWAFFVY